MHLNEFQVSGAELANRRRRCRPIVDRLDGLPTEMVDPCQICGASEPFVLASEDRYGLPLRSALCLRCGLVYQLDRFTRDGFRDFYRGAYRELVSAFKGKDEGDLGRLVAKQRVYGGALLNVLRGRLAPERVDHILDIGGSTGVVAGMFCDAFSATATVVDPAPDELALADQRFASAETTLEDWEVDGRYDLILLCNTIEHLHDLPQSFAKMRAALTDDGLLLCDVADFMASARIEGPAEVLAKVDHCFWLSWETAPEIFQALGFEPVWVAAGRLPQQVTFLLRPTAPQPFSERLPAASDMAGELQRLRAEWLDAAHRTGRLSRSRFLSLVRRTLGRS